HVRHEQPALPGLRPLLARRQVAPGLELGRQVRAQLLRAESVRLALLLAPRGLLRAQRIEARLVELLDEVHVPPRRRREVARVVVRDGAEVEALGRQVVPLLARDLARLAADADG